jgi:hypothetical protein
VEIFDMVEDRKATAKTLSTGDSIGLVALVFAVIAFTITPSPRAKIVLLLLIGGVATIVRFSHWTRTWSRIKRSIGWIVSSVVLLGIGIPQINEQLKAEHRQALSDLYIGTINLTKVLFAGSWMQRSFWAFVGGVSILCLQLVIIAVNNYLRRMKAFQSTDKGFLDYKLQAETAMSDLSPTLAPISEIMFQVGKMIEEQTRRASEVALVETRAQLLVVRRSAKKLNRFSHQMESKCSRLEDNGRILEEGMLGWFKWLNGQQDHDSELVAVAIPLRSLCNSMEEAIRQSNRYISTLENAKGVSRDMNVASDAHIRVVTRVHEATLKIWDCCIQALKLTKADQAID